MSVSRIRNPEQSDKSNLAFVTAIVSGQQESKGEATLDQESPGSIPGGATLQDNLEE